MPNSFESFTFWGLMNAVVRKLASDGGFVRIVSNRGCYFEGPLFTPGTPEEIVSCIVGAKL
jgi:hypothetical protein